MCACKSPSWTRQQDEALEAVNGSDHGPIKEDSCQAAKTEDLKCDWLKINQIETSCRKSVSLGDGNQRTAQPWSIDDNNERSLSLEDLDTPAQLSSHEQSLLKPVDSPTGNAPDSGNDGPNNSGGYFWECPSPYPPNFGSESASDDALLEAPPSPCLSPFDFAGSSLSKASES